MAKPVWSVQQIVAQLNRDGHFWANSTIQYDFQTALPSDYANDKDTDYSGWVALTPTERQFVRLAFSEISDLINVNFVEAPGDEQSGGDTHRVTFGAATTLPDYEWGHTQWTYYTGTNAMAGADIFFNETNVNTRSWVINGYNFMATMHEIMHSLGVDHPGDYNADGSDITYANNAAYFQDSRQYSIMSYFAASETGANYNSGGIIYSPGTPMRDDVAALQAVYGANMSTRTGDTVYGFHSNAGRDVYDAVKQPVQIYTIWDAGGNDTLDYSGYAARQTIDLHQGAYSNVGGLTYNVAIAYGAQIENAIGGSGADVLIGNELANVLTGGLGADTLTGAGGADVFRDTGAGLGGDTITDFARGDTIDVTDAAYASFSYQRLGSTLTLGSGQAISLSGGLNGRLLVGADAGAGVNLSIGAHVTSLNDFNADGHSDLLWRNLASGDFATWQLSGNSSTQARVNVDYDASVPLAWRLEGTIDFNGDGASDLVWRNPTSGAFAIWDATGNGGFSVNSLFDGSVGSSWGMAGFGDFNADGKDDILWRNADGTVAEWQSTGAGFVQNTFVDQVTASWHVEAIGDFTGDGRSDVLWREDSGLVSAWTSTGTGFSENTFVEAVIPTWHVAATGDFNGDGRDDILWRNDSGALTVWSSNGTGFAENTYGDFVPTDWRVVGTYDVNDDGRADIVWRNDSGALSVWTSTGSGFVQNAFTAGAPTDWTIVAHHYDII